MRRNPPQVPGYEVGRLLGSGGVADVWELIDASGVRFAGKIFRDTNVRASRREWKALQQNAGPHVVPVVDSLTDAEDRPVIVMSIMDGGTLWDVASGRNGLTSGELVTALAPIAGVLAALHDSGRVHGDVTPRNVLFDGSGKPALSDFGTSAFTAFAREAAWATSGFVAPEVLDGEAPGPESDMYSFGASAWFALTAQAPPIPAMRPRLADVAPGIPADVAELVTACLSLTPSARPEARQAHRVLSSAIRAEAVPINADVSQNAGCITRRLRDEAQREQLRPRRAQPVRSKRRRVPLKPPVIAATLAITGATATAVWPSDARSSNSAHTVVSLQPADHVKEAGKKPQAEGRAPEGKRSSGVAAAAESAPSPANVAAVDDRTIRQLLACRANAWNAGQTSRLEACLAPDSSALADDTKVLRLALSRGVTYRGVGFRLDSVIRRESQADGRVAVTVNVTRSAFVMASASEKKTVPKASSSVTLIIDGLGARARLSEWRPLSDSPDPTPDPN